MGSSLRSFLLGEGIDRVERVERFVGVERLVKHSLTISARGLKSAAGNFPQFIKCGGGFRPTFHEK